MSRDFFQLCYDQYKQEITETDSLYQKASLMLLVIPLLGTIVATLGRIDILNLCFMRVNAFFYYFASCIAVLALATSVVFLFLCVYPRKYRTLASMDYWRTWRENYQKHLDEKENDDAAELDKAMFENLCPRLAEAQSVNAGINEKRRAAFKRSVQMGAIAVAAVGLQALFNLILNIQGV